jgi:LacI family transcriptional regulator
MSAAARNHQRFPSSGDPPRSEPVLVPYSRRKLERATGAVPKRKRVALLIESSRAYGRACLSGVASYVRTHGTWTVLHLERGLTDEIPRAVRQWQSDGIITRISSARMAAVVGELGIPAVDLRGSYCPKDGAMLDTDHRMVARLAANHFLETGFRNLAYCGYPGLDFSDQRQGAFEAFLANQGYHVYSYQSRENEPLRDVIQREVKGEFENESIAAWLQQLPRPVAVFACNDVRGRQVLEACSQCGLTVPEEVAVLGVDNDELICEFSSPPLSSIEPDAHRIGYEGAALLDRMIDGEPPPDQTILIPPIALHRRLSSEATATDDPEVAAAMRVIRDRACQGLNVDDVVRLVGISRSTLERRFRRVFGRSPALEIERVRMARAKLMLAGTTYKLAKIANMTGYKSAAQFATAFKRHEGKTPGNYRHVTSKGGT